MFDRRVADAQPRVDEARLEDGVGRASVDARGARSARSVGDRVGGRLEVDVEDQLGQEEPRAEARVEQVRGLRREAQARGGGVAPFQERRRIDEARAGLRETLGLEPPAELAQALADDVVVVAARGVARDPSAAR